MTMGDRLVVMNDGEIAQIGDPDTVYSEPANLFVAMFIGSPQINRFDSVVAGDDALEAGDLRFELPAADAEALADATDDRVALCVRPRHLTWSEEPDDGGLAVPVTVTVTEQIGTEDIVRCETGNGVEVTAVVPANTLEFGQEGHLVFDADNLHLFDGSDDSAERLN